MRQGEREPRAGLEEHLNSHKGCTFNFPTAWHFLDSSPGSQGLGSGLGLIVASGDGLATVQGSTTCCDVDDQAQWVGDCMKLLQGAVAGAQNVPEISRLSPG